MVETQEPQTRDIPLWLTGLVLILCIGGGGWLIHWYMHDPGMQSVSVPPDDPAVKGLAGRFKGPLADYSPGAAGARGAQFDTQSGPVDGVRTSGPRGNAWIVRAGEATMYASLGRDGKIDLSPSYATQHLTADQAQVLLMRRRLLTDPAARERIKLTDAQLDQLKKVDDFKGMIVNPLDKSKLTTLFEAWRKGNDQPNAEKALVASLADVGKRSADATKQFDASRVDQVKKILTPEQLQLFNEPATPGAPTPQKAPPSAPPTKPAA